MKKCGYHSINDKEQDWGLMFQKNLHQKQTRTDRQRNNKKNKKQK